MPNRAVGRQGTPFPFEGPVPSDLLIGRQSELAELARRSADRVNVRLAAPRRFGKTSLVAAHAEQLAQAGWRTVHVDLSRVADTTDVARRVAAAYGHLDSPWMKAHLRGLLGKIGVSLSVAGPAVSVGQRPQTAQPAAAGSVLLGLLDLPVELWRRDRLPTLVVFDEFQDLLVARKDLDGLLRSRIQYHQDAACYVFAGSEPSLMRELFEDRERPLFGQALAVALGPLPAEETISALAGRFQAEELDPGASLGDLVVFAEGHPQRTMLLAYLLASALDPTGSRSEDPPTPSAALTERVIDEAIDMTAAIHQATWSASDAPERAVLAAVADGSAPTSAAVAADHNVAKTTLAAAAARLADRGQLDRRPRANRLVDPLLAEWIRRR